MSEFQLDTDAARVADALMRSATQLGELEPVNRQAGAIITAAPAPHRSGLLAASVRADVTAHGVTAAGHTRYWTFVHWGAPRRNIAARPWLLAPVAEPDPRIIELYANHMATTVAAIE